MSEVVSVCGVILPKLVPPNRRDLYEDSINTSAGKPRYECIWENDKICISLQYELLVVIYLWQI